ncbi:MAG: hypothetical protein JRJ87_06085 [Deltaproteobacteria bacterium]|nr:hypothetical protein [Deltaproteobacteria bacterium]
MGRLANFKDYLVDCRGMVSAADKHLSQLQEKYESFFAEVSKVREHEYEQLRDHILDNRDKLPTELIKALDASRAEVEQEFDEKLKKLRAQHKKAVARAEKRRLDSLKKEKLIRKKNVRLDKEEEGLKDRSEKLLNQIKEFNQRIRQMGRGFGFFTNLFKMRKIQKERRRLAKEQTDTAARIEVLRGRWEKYDEDYAKNEKKLQQEWIDLNTEANSFHTKIDHLEAARAHILQRSAIEKVVFNRLADMPKPQPSDPACPRCKHPNPIGYHFCHICAKRLNQDRPDLDGSLAEIAELNLHHRRFSEGMQACQEIIGLMRGLMSGFDAFMKGVDDMITSENKYPLAKLQINVPPKSVSYGQNFAKLEKSVKQDHSLHPIEFAQQIKELIADTYTEEKIKTYFETMGQELTIQADKQW